MVMRKAHRRLALTVRLQVRLVTTTDPYCIQLDTWLVPDRSWVCVPSCRMRWQNAVHGTGPLPTGARRLSLPICVRAAPHPTLPRD
eukprot:3716405-Prymnesium_polylepis.2